MRKRRFRFKTPELALQYIAVLLTGGLSFSVECHTTGVEVITQFELQPQDFPRAEWLQ